MFLISLVVARYLVVLCNILLVAGVTRVTCFPLVLLILPRFTKPNQMMVGFAGFTSNSCISSLYLDVKKHHKPLNYPIEKRGFPINLSTMEASFNEVNQKDLQT